MKNNFKLAINRKSSWIELFLNKMKREVKKMDKNGPCMKVKCGVENCTYNKELMCFADALEVNSMKGHQAGISDETCCTTFESGK